MSAWISRKVLAALVVCLAAGCDPRSETDYVVVKAFQDEATGRYVELGELINISSFCFVINVFEAASEERKATDVPDSPLVIACSVGQAEPWFGLADGCFTLKLDYGYGGVRRESWIDPETGRSICLRMVPPGPKGGWTP